MKLCAISDLHGTLIDNIEKDLDYLLIAGDILPLNVQMNSRGSKKWLKEFFVPWLDGIGAKKVIVIGGNHDFYLEGHKDDVKNIFGDSATYLFNEYYIDENIQLYGTPLCKIFGNWAFMYTQDAQEEIFKDVELGEKEKLRIILSHDSPYNVSDILLEKVPWADGKHIGNIALGNLMTRTNPDLLIHGHLHSTNHEIELSNNTKVVCVSILGEDYRVHYKPFYYEW
jgi:Icc-related predicted phosphoesterase